MRWRTLLLAGILIALALLVVTRASFPRRIPATPPLRSSTPPAEVASAPLPPSAPAATPEPASSDPEPEEASPKGWLNVRLDTGGDTPPAKLYLRVYSRTGSEKSEELPGAESLKIGPLTPGEKALFAYPASTSFGATVVVATVVGQADVEVLLKLPKAFPVTGVVVDNTGRPVPGLTVDVEEFFPLKFLRPAEGSSSHGTAWGGFGGRSIQAGGRRSVPSHYSFLVTRDGLRFTFGAGTDDEGRFILPHGVSQPAVTLSILREKALVQKESVVPSGGPLRLVIPVQEEEPKK